MWCKEDFEEYTLWYISAVKSYLILRNGYLEGDADYAIRRYRLKERLQECPDIAFHDDPRTIAKEIAKQQYIVTEEDLMAGEETELICDPIAKALEESKVNTPKEVYVDTDAMSREELDEFYDNMLGDLTIPGPEKEQEMLQVIIGGGHDDE